MKASRLSSRFSTTIPMQVREALNLAVGDAISYEILDERRVLMTRVDPSVPPPPSTAEQGSSSGPWDDFFSSEGMDLACPREEF